MAERSFQSDEVRKLLCNKFVVIIGDSVQRGIYKDLVLLLQKNNYLLPENLKNKGEVSFERDKLIEGGRLGPMTNGLDYREVRQYQTDHHLIRFYFVTRCYNPYMSSILADLSEEPRPDVVIMNSCLWDISRYGIEAIESYKQNLEKLFARLPSVLPETCLIIWNTTLPISKDARGGFLVKEVEFLKGSLRLDILEANFYAAHKAVKQNWDVLDLHYYLRYEMFRRTPDGVHWDMVAHRTITNLLLTHIVDAWGVELPCSRRRRDSSAKREVNQENQGINKSENFQFGLGLTHHNSNQNLLSGIHNLAFNLVQEVSVPNRNGPLNGGCYQFSGSGFENCYQMEDWRRNGVCRARAVPSVSRYGPYGDKRHR